MSSLLKVIPDIECDLYIDYEYKCHLPVGQMTKVEIRRGTYIIEFKLNDFILHSKELFIETSDEEILYKFDYLIDNQSRILTYNSKEEETIKSNAFDKDVIFHAYRDGHGIVIFEDAPTIIYDSAFEYSNFTTLNLPNTIIELGERAFGDSNLNSIVLPNSIITIGREAFVRCDNLCEIFLPDTLITLGDYAFYECKSLKEIFIPSNVISINRSVFEGCSNLNSVFLSQGLTEIGIMAFYGCNNLYKILFPNTLRSIGELAFCGCDSMLSIEIPESVEYIDERAFSSCSNLWKLVIKGSPTIFDMAFVACTSLREGILPDGGLMPHGSSFRGCESLEYIKIPKSVTEIGGWMFEGCSSLVNIVLPDTLCVIHGSAFQDCSNLQHIHIPNSVVEIGNSAFAGCTSLKQIVLPKNLSTMDYRVFSNCYNLKSIYFSSLAPPTPSNPTCLRLKTPYEFPFCEIYVPAESLNAYKSSVFFQKKSYGILGFDLDNSAV